MDYEAMELEELVDETPVPEWRGYNLGLHKAQATQTQSLSDYEQGGKDEWLDVLISMWEAIGKPVDEKRLAKYSKELRSLPLGLLEEAVSQAIRNNGEYQTVPTISAIWAEVKKVLHNPLDVDTAVERWIDRHYQQAVRRFE